ncbi:MAG: AMP-binding protein, partial [Alphaproteobacteria bacterium]
MPRAYEPKAAQRGIFDALLEAREKWGGKRPILEDHERRVLTYTDLIRAAFALGRKIADVTEKGERVAVLLPTGVGSTVVFYALHAYGRVPVMLNFSAGIRNVRTACKTAGVKRVLTARKFVELGKLEDLTDALEIKYEITWLEDVRAKIGLLDKIAAAIADKAPRRFRVETGPSDPGVILFTSGSYGAPKGVMLTQGGMLANCDQVAAAIDLNPNWVFFNPLPVFHAFGLLGGVMLPILYGLKAFNYPSPLHVKLIPSLLKESRASILLATDTFLTQYARNSETDELAGLEFIVCGAERVRDETHDLIARQFNGLKVIEGYGATECSPVVAVNTPIDNRRGTVGGLLPGMEARLEPIEGITAGAKLLVRGP